MRGRLPIDPSRVGDPVLVLAPMDGITCAVWREVMTEIDGGDSGIDLCVSEFVRVTGTAVPAHVLLREVPELAHGARTPAGVPVAVQILGGDPPAMAATAATVARMGAAVIDINFGCPARTVNNHDGGATLLRAPCRIEAVVAAVRAAVDASVHVSAKVRLGWDSADGIVDIARAAEAGGASWLTIHARTRTQLYRPPVDWHAIGRARAAIAIPVVANGDLCSPGDVAACRAASGCEAFMIGRAAMGDPRLFQRVRGHAAADVRGPWFAALLQTYVARLCARGTSEHGALGKLKQWLRYGAAIRTELARAFDRVKSLTQLDAALATATAVLCERVDYGSMRQASPSSVASPLP